MAVRDQNRKIKEASNLYKRYGKPLERKHSGEFLAVSLRGKTILGPTVLDVLKRATDSFGPGNFIFRVGQKTIGRWR